MASAAATRPLSLNFTISAVTRRHTVPVNRKHSAQALNSPALPGGGSTAKLPDCAKERERSDPPHSPLALGSANRSSNTSLRELLSVTRHVAASRHRTERHCDRGQSFAAFALRKNRERSDRP